MGKLVLDEFFFFFFAQSVHFNILIRVDLTISLNCKGLYQQFHSIRHENASTNKRGHQYVYIHVCS